MQLEACQELLACRLEAMACMQVRLGEEGMGGGVWGGGGGGGRMRLTRTSRYLVCPSPCMCVFVEGGRIPHTVCVCVVCVWGGVCPSHLTPHTSHHVCVYCYRSHLTHIMRVYYMSHLCPSPEHTLVAYALICPLADTLSPEKTHHA